MSTFVDFLNERLQTGAFATEDALASFLPLVRQVVAAHRAGKVAPLQGVQAIHVENGRLWYEEALAANPALKPGDVRAIEAPASQSVEIVGEYRVDVSVEHGSAPFVSLQIGRRGEPVTQPVYLPGYVCWEHEAGHHDPLTDVFVLGLVLASLACGLDLNDPEDLADFVRHRPNLFELNAGVHPVLAKAVARMTELRRQRRPQDLAALLRTLENYRDQDVDFDTALARLPNFTSTDRPGRRAMILACLQQRLFEISRRNRLLHFRATAQTLNLTWASVPLSFDVKNIRPEQILTWGHDFGDAVRTGKTIALNKYLRFEEALYLPGQLDQIRTEAKRDQAEYGFAQLRLVLCFLRWSNLKEKPSERFDSPLVLLPVRLSKTKGVRDVFGLEPLTTEAEINPVLRFYLKQLYAVDLPETVDLASSSLEDLHAFIAGKVQANEPAVTVEMVDKPRINLLHAKAQRRLDQYRRRFRLSGRGARSFWDIDYSYERTNYHPLGLRIFQTRVLPAEPHLRTIVDESPRPRTQMAADAETPVAEKERQLYARVEEETNPYRWEFDLCNVTLGNFHYRKMSLVRDYSLLLDQNQPQPAFDAIFSLQPRDLLTEPPKPLPVEEGFPIVPSDPTQASAIALARTGRHFIIQGPPGTGKSQTITNLIADFVAAGKRVLFVCEKRAAIDVVYHRLRQSGLQELCCLIHDAQDDKKAFILDLKATYEAFSGTKESAAVAVDDQRRRSADGLAKELAPLARFQAAMTAVPETAGVPLRQLLVRAIELRTEQPDQSPTERERIPSFHLWQANRGVIERLYESLDPGDGGPILARHPLRRLHARFADVERPIAAAQALLDRVGPLLQKIQAGLPLLDIPASCWETFDNAIRLIDYATSLNFLAHSSLLSLLDDKTDRARGLAASRKKFTAIQRELDQARTETTHWRQKLPAEETLAALEQARQWERSLVRFVRPSWWRLRGLLRRNYDFTAHQVRPTYSRVLEKLVAEHQVVEAVVKLEAEARDDFSFEGPFAEYSAAVARLTEEAEKLPAHLRDFHHIAIGTPGGREIVQRLADLQPTAAELRRDLGSLLAGHEDLSLPQLRDELERAAESLDELPAFMPCLKELGRLPAAVADAIRRFDLTHPRLEAASASRTITEILHADPPFARFTRATRARRIEKLERLNAQWHTVNAGTVRSRVCRRFLQNARGEPEGPGLANTTKKEFKARYDAGRRELEHEFGKTMRYRSIRDLVGGVSGLVLRDLKPVWLMSPLSVSDALPLEAMFDVVIFDEASQVTLEEAVPAIFRATQVVVVGDEMQLPPTNFFAGKAADEEESLVVGDEAGGTVSYDLGSNSLLEHAARNLPATLLGWHYRSRSESLVSFSNAAFYQGRLLTVPEVTLPVAPRGEIVARAPAEGFENTDRLLDRPVSFHLLEKGVYDSRRNAAEADYIAQLVRGLLARASGLSIGIIAFSEAQQGEIESALHRLAAEDGEFASRLEAEWEREDDGQFVGLLVKNLENIQGDERDVIILSVCYGHGPGGKMLMNFGPINQNGGERRLNVAFSRAKRHMALVASIRPPAITNDYNTGARTLRDYLRYAEAMSVGDLATARRVLAEVNTADGPRVRRRESDVVVLQLAAELRQRGHRVDLDVGQSGFRCDLAVRREGEDRFRLGILVDTDEYYENPDLMERDVLRPRLLQTFGWDIAFVLTKEWLADREGVLRSVEGQLVSK